LRKEASIVNHLAKLEGEEGQPGKQLDGDALERLLQQASKVLAEMHWAIERLHAGLYICCLRTARHQEEFHHQAARLRFMEARLPRPSLRRGIERSKLAEAARRRGQFEEAMAIGSAALEELLQVVLEDRAVLPPCHRERWDNPCAIVRSRLRAYLRGEEPKR